MGNEHLTTWALGRAQQAIIESAQGADCKIINYANGAAVEISVRGYDTVQSVRVRIEPIALALDAVRREVLEEAALVADADEVPCPTHYSGTVAKVVRERIARNIRALK